MATKDEITAIIASIADRRATFDEVDVLGRYSSDEMDEYLNSLLED